MLSSIPRWPAGSDRSWDGLFQPFPCSPAATAFPKQGLGRRTHWTFRGLLDVHLRYGLPARCIAKRYICLEGSDGFVSSPRRFDSYRLERTSCRVGVTPTEDQHLLHGAPLFATLNLEKKCALAVDLYQQKKHTVGEICKMAGISKPMRYAYIREEEQGG